MPKVTHVKAARKAHPSIGVEIGESYYHWSLMSGGRGVKHMSKEPPKPWQLTNSEFKKQYLGLDDNIQNLTATDSLGDDVQSFADEIRTLGEEQREKLDSMPEGLQQGDTGQLLEGREESCEEWATELEDAITSVPDEPSQERTEGDDEWEEYDAAMESILEDVQNCVYNGE